MKKTLTTFLIAILLAACSGPGTQTGTERAIADYITATIRGIKADYNVSATITDRPSTIAAVDSISTLVAKFGIAPAPSGIEVVRAKVRVDDGARALEDTYDFYILPDGTVAGKIAVK